ncbi:hypothetical protein prwr041_24900 [Prevotella herbatica]|uniref:Helicase n=1 Tax=Prevotella herbatica TaxID=2801997 RepID=A0ABN6EKV5_9BACT|nr:DEAD/DEAH box helicase [Prevotella herbatica]BCS86597.1 hypothetical protein prwr041_24900 [Prevotella herbatica]
MLDKMWFDIDVELTDFIFSLCTELHKEGPVDSDVLESLSIIKSLYPEKIAPFENDILYYMGLFYKTTKPTNFKELIYQEFADSIKETTSCDFTPVQADAFNKIKSSNNFSFSAPTSTGKSFLFNKLLQEAKGDVIVVVPSRALLSEYISKISVVVGKDVLVLSFIDIINKKKTKRNIFVITPERGDDLFQKIDELNIDLFMFDEAQLTEDKLRGLKFDSFVRRVNKKCPKAKKVFAHPFIDNPEAQIIKNKLIGKSSFANYQQRSVGKIFLTRKKNDSFVYFSPFNDKTNGDIVYNGDPIECVLNRKGTCLIYVSKNSIYTSVISEKIQRYIVQCPLIADSRALKYIEKVEEFLGSNKRKSSMIVEMMRHGIIIHHGSIPLRVRSIIEQFITAGYARLCFATSTLIQGVNMPFDLVWIDNFRFWGSDDEKSLDLKNLIGRAGRTNEKSNTFDFGYVVINESNRGKFTERLLYTSRISEDSLLDLEGHDIFEDVEDEINAIINDDFDIDLKMPNIQVERLKDSNIDVDIAYILDSFFVNGKPISGKEYYNISKVQRDKIKKAFQHIFVSHLNRRELVGGERSVLSTAIPLLLWTIQGKTFAEIVSLRYSFLSMREEQARLTKQLVEGFISEPIFLQEQDKLRVRESPSAHSLPDKSYTKSNSLFKDMSPMKLSYDLVIYDTYDYMDKVISLSLKNPMCAAFFLYYDKTNDSRALALSNYISYGTNDRKEIWLKRYGFEQEDMEWLKPCVDDIDENQITFNDNIKQYLDDEQKSVLLERYI